MAAETCPCRGCTNAYAAGYKMGRHDAATAADDVLLDILDGAIDRDRFLEITRGDGEQG